MGEHETTGIFESIVKRLPGNKDIYFWNFVILMVLLCLKLQQYSLPRCQEPI